MRKLALVLSAVAMVGGLTAVAMAAPHVTDIPEGQIPAVPGDEGTVPCDILIRYDDGSDDSPGSGYTLGYYSGSAHQFLGQIFTTPAGSDHEVQSASFFSEFWVLPGMVDIEVTEVGNSGNTTTASVSVSAGGTYEVAFETPICIPAGRDYEVMICPRVGVFGVGGEDYSAPLRAQAYWSDGGCDPVNSLGAVDLMLWSCVTPCGATPTIETTWGELKDIYR